MERYPFILKAINSGSKVYPDKDLYAVSTNPLERSLAYTLSEYFGRKLFTNLKVGFYYPDIAFIDVEKDILIDIEIDEPYSRSKIPTHFIGDLNDIQRNKFFTANGWYVIRFSENQVKNQLNNVIKTIDLFIKSLASHSNQEFEYFLNSFFENQWTYAEAQNSMTSFQRDYYNYKVVNTEQIECSIIKEFPKLEFLFENIINHYFPNFNHRDDIILLPYYISDQYISISDKSKLIFLDCITQQGKILIREILCRFCHFPDYPKIEVTNTNDLNRYELITRKKMNNFQVYVKDDYHFIHYFYDFFFIGTMQDYHKSNLKFYPNF